jgi:hypothetical protein
MKENGKATRRVAKAIYERSIDAEGVSPEISDRLERLAGNALMELFGVEPRPKDPDPQDLARKLMEGIDYDPNVRQEDPGVRTTRRRMMSVIQLDLQEKLQELQEVLVGNDNADAAMARFERMVKERPTFETRDAIEKFIQNTLVTQFRNQSDVRPRRR